MHHVSRPAEGCEVDNIVLLSIELRKKEELGGHMEGGTVGPNSKS